MVDLIVSQGDSTQNNYVWNLVGDHDSGWILLIFAGIDNTTQSPDTKLNIIVRLSPPWGQEYHRDA